MNPRLLVVEDETKIANLLRRGLSEEGYEVDVAGDGEEGLAMALQGEYQLIVLDIGLPEKDGWEVCRDLRAKGRLTPIIFLTARDSVHDKVAGLDLGADDYLTKPFAFEELVARVRSLLRKVQMHSDSRLRIADLVLDTRTRKVERAGVPIDLSTKEFALLQYLLEHRGTVLSRMDISDKVWDIHFDTTTNVIDVHINRLRKKIDADFPVKLIQTVRGAGYTIGEE